MGVLKANGITGDYVSKAVHEMLAEAIRLDDALLLLEACEEGLKYTDEARGLGIDSDVEDEERTAPGSRLAAP